MEKDKNQQMKRLGLILLFHAYFPLIMMVIGSFYVKTIIGLIGELLFVVLWILIFVRMYVKKINKLKQETDAEQ